MKKFLKLFLVATVLVSTLFLGMNVFAITRLPISTAYQIDPYANNPIQTIKGGVVRVIDSATGDIARTTSGVIEDIKYGWYAVSGATAWSAEFDSAVKMTGNFTLKISTTDITGKASAYIKAHCKPNTTYIMNLNALTNNAATNAVYFQASEYTNWSGTYAGTNNTSNKISGTNITPQLLTKTFTTGASTNALYIYCYVNVAGNISDAWFDVNSMTLEEVSTITAPSASKLYPKVTAVSSVDNIDQSVITAGANGSFGNAGTNQKSAERFTPTKKNLTGIIFQRYADAGTYIGDVTVSIQTNNSGVPSGTVVNSIILTNAQWEAITTSADYTLSIPCTLTPGTQYWIVFESSTQDASNYPQFIRNTSGSGRYNYNGSTWASAGNDLYFKTLYQKNTDNFTIRTDTETMSVTAPTTDGWEDGTVIDTFTYSPAVTPLTLSAGVNNIYYSSNGALTADGTVDASLQAIINPVIYRLFPRIASPTRLPATTRLPI